MWFKNPEHERYYTKFLEKAQVRSGEREYLAALYVLAVLNKPVEQYISPGQVALDKFIKTARPWSSGEKALVKLAAALFNSTFWKVRVHDVFCSLDSSNCQVALEALKTRYQR